MRLRSNRWRPTSTTSDCEPNSRPSWGYYPATLDPEDIERHRRLNAALDAAPTREKVARRYAHLNGEKRRNEDEAQGRAEVADLYE